MNKKKVVYISIELTVKLNILLQAKRGGNSGYTKSVTLSPELASLMGSEALPRHEVVKKMWAIIKERNLYVSCIIQSLILLT